MTGPVVHPPAGGDRPARKLLSGTTLVVAASVLVVVTAVVVLVLWWPATKGLTGNELVAARFDALRIGLSIGVGSGGVIVLYLAWRRQRSMEDTLAHQERVAASTEDDARERRITDLYTKAADQLGSDQAAVRLAGLYALERLAQDHPKQRQTIVNVLCAYLRMPFDLPADPPALLGDSSDADSDGERQQYRELLTDHRERVQEREVRRTAQRIIGTHSRPGPGGVNNAVDTYWPDLEIDFTGAMLDAPDFKSCYFSKLLLGNANISGMANFGKVEFVGTTWFAGAQFEGLAWFGEARFEGDTGFHDARFKSSVRFDEAHFEAKVEFSKAQFDDGAWFGDVRFKSSVRFDGAHFKANTSFDEAQFESDASFRATHFADTARFKGARFEVNAEFDEAQFEDDAWFGATQFKSDARFGDAHFKKDAWFREAQFEGGVWFNETRFEGEVWLSEAQISAVNIDGASFALGIPSELTALPAVGGIPTARP